MKRQLRILLVEDSESDAGLIKRQLDRMQIEVRIERVESPDGMARALEAQEWDAVISDHKLPQFSSPEALALLQKTGIDIPFIVVSGTIGEDTAVSIMRAGAHDYLMKDKLARLPMAIEREIGSAQMRRDRRKADADLRRMLEWQAAIFEGSRDAIFISDSDARFVAVNRSACELTGYARDELMTMRIPDLHRKEDLRAFEDFHSRILAGEQVLSEARILTKNGCSVDAEFNNTRIIVGDVVYMHTTARDVSERKQAELIMKQQVVAMDTAVDGMAILDDSGRYLYVNQAHARI